jgi:microsomal epoxide hydrolase
MKPQRNRHQWIAHRAKSSILGSILLAGIVLAVSPARAADRKPPGTKSGVITTPDGIKIHYLEAGHVKKYAAAELGDPLPPGKVPTKGNIAVTDPYQVPSILFIPGWTMPAWIWEKQIAYFSKDYRVVAMDPRSQGESSQTGDGLYPTAMARDIKAVIDELHLSPVVIVAWSMAVVETMSYVDQFGTGALAGIVLVDNDAGGRSPGDADQDFALLKGVLEDRNNSANAFIRKLNFKKPQPEDYLQSLVKASLKVPTDMAVSLLVGYFVADYRSVLARIDKPALVCAAKTPYMDTIVAMQKNIKDSKLEVFDDAGHALFVDDADKFNVLLENFLQDMKW